MPSFDQGYDEKEILKKVALGDEQAFNIIYRHYNAMIFSAAMTYVKQTSTAQEIVQQVFIKIWEKRASVVEINNFQDYIVVISRNLVYDHFRRLHLELKKLNELSSRQKDIPNTGPDGEERIYAQALRAAIADLPAQQQKIYVLVTEEQLSYDVVASRLGLSKFTVKRHLELARKSVRDHVKKYIE